MTGLVITQAALHAILLSARDEVVRGSTSRGVGMIDTLVTALDPAHAAPGAKWHGFLRDAAGLFHAPTLAADEAQAAHRDHLTAGPGALHGAVVDTPAAEGATTAPKAPPPAQAAEGRHPADTIPGKWTPERIALLTEHLPTCVDRPALLEIINERPGLPIATAKAMMVKARALGIQVESWVPRAIETAAGARGGRSTETGTPTKTSEVRTAERFAAFPALWMDPALSVPEIHARMNAMPGEPVKTSTQLYGWAKKAGLPTQRPLPPADLEDEDDAAEAAAPEASEPPPAPPEPAPEPAAPAPRALNPRNSKAGPALTGEASAKADAFDAFTAGQTVRQVADEFGIGLNTISTWHAEWMRAPKKETAA